MAEGISIQSRDLSVLRSLFESRILTTKHIAAFHFDGSAEATKKRLQKLKAAGLLSERKRKAYEPSLLSISQAGFKILKAEGALTEYPSLSWAALERRNQVSELTLRHELSVLDVKAAFYSALRGSEKYSVKKFTTWPLLSQFSANAPVPFGGTQKTVIKPDGFILIGEKAEDGNYEHTFFLELDRSTETLETVCRKCSCYVDYYRSGGFAVSNGKTKADFKEFPFRVLVVCKSEDRIKSVVRALRSMTPTISSQVVLNSLTQVLAIPFSGWRLPKSHFTQSQDSLF